MVIYKIYLGEHGPVLDTCITYVTGSWSFHPMKTLNLNLSKEIGYYEYRDWADQLLLVNLLQISLPLLNGAHNLFQFYFIIKLIVLPNILHLKETKNNCSVLSQFVDLYVPLEDFAPDTLEIDVREYILRDLENFVRRQFSGKGFILNRGILVEDFTNFVLSTMVIHQVVIPTYSMKLKALWIINEYWGELS